MCVQQTRIRSWLGIMKNFRNLIRMCYTLYLVLCKHLEQAQCSIQYTVTSYNSKLSLSFVKYFQSFFECHVQSLDDKKIYFFIIWPK